MNQIKPNFRDMQSGEFVDWISPRRFDLLKKFSYAMHLSIMIRLIQKSGCMIFIQKNNCMMLVQGSFEEVD